MNTEPSWDVYRSFAAVLREGSLSGAARALGMTQPSIARHIDALERAIDGTLFVRSQRGLSPTDRALALRPHADALVAATEALRRSGSGAPDAVAGVVRISASQAVGVGHLPPILTELRTRHGALTIELSLSDQPDDLLQRRADIAVRMFAPTQQALVARHVGEVPLGFHAHRDYLDRRGVPATLAELSGHDLIGFDTETDFIRAAMRHLPGIDRSRFALRVDSDAAQFAAIRAGFGIGICQTAIARRDPALVRVLADALDLPLPLWIVMHEDLRRIARYRAVFDALATGLARLAAG
ncbi:MULTISPECIES: LysR family transcriptional regulator [unclassified Sphingomonas]|jgi:DNA-binding transcriptional LysR family regulator|uniref:LysR family transcriptional regulator n=1 Tax=unclassified Sphingomonas TaxID=196159 RepID=UPI000E10239E|nr:MULTISPECIES: LysR family transcriptional regulator [unclassified Sphingomonas]AXJ94153.1 LysR family transcriptional regulator [Sphingomonas sp. FARSPH]